MFSKERTVGYVGCGCIGYREWSASELSDETPQTPRETGLPRRYRGAEGGGDYARQVMGGRWLYIYGDVGVGKTYLACAILRHLEREGTTLFASAVESTALDAQDAPKRARFLVLDDLGKETASEWSVAKVWEILNHRYNEELPTVITSQYSLEQLPERIERHGDYASALAIVSRLYEMCDTIHLRGEDRRTL